MSCDLKQIAKDIRCNIVECIGSIGVGHIGGCLSIVELLAVLYFQEMNILQVILLLQLQKDILI